MCGIFASNDPLVDKKHFTIINKYLKFRGPDYNSKLLETQKNWKLYHSRLSIIGLDKKFNQPLKLSDDSLLLFNGEIFNFKELSKKYLNIEKPISDTHVLGELLLIKNFDVNNLEGFFSYVRISKTGKLLNCARDFFGVKPLFYFKRKNFLTISSECSVIKKIFNLNYSNKALKEYKIFRYPIFQKSYFRNIKSIEQGTCLVNGKFFDLKKEFKKNLFHKKLLKKNLEKSIKSRHTSDVPIGILISSGIDSGLIKSLGKKKELYYAGSKNDLDYKRVKFKNKILIKTPTKNEFKKRFKSMVKNRQEPLSVPNEVMLSLVGSLAKKRGIKVLLSGEGADEFFGGYDRIFSWAKKQKKFSTLKFIKMYAYNEDYIDNRIIKSLKEIFKNLKKFTPFEKVKYFFIKFHLPILFRRLDYSLMFAGIEGREPLASKSLFYHSLMYKPNQLINNIVGKLPLREIAKKFYGKKYAYSKKIGFPVDLCIYMGCHSKTNQYKFWFNENIRMINEI